MDRAAIGTLFGQIVLELIPTIMNKESTVVYNTLEELQLRREQLSEEIERESELIGVLWDELFHKKETSTKGQFVASIMANSVTAIDAFLLARKLMKNYGSVASLFGIGKKKKR